jgi:aconitate hydratase
MSIHEASVRYRAAGIPTIVFAGTEYGTGSSRDWAAKGPRLLGVRAVVAQSFERIHRSNLVGMGVLPLQFREGDTLDSLGIAGDEVFHIRGLTGTLQPRQEVLLEVVDRQGRSRSVPLHLRVDTAIEVDYLSHGGILPYVLRELLSAA